MNEDNYSKRELDDKFLHVGDQINDLRNDMGEQFEANMKILGDIKDQTTKTNGSVAAVKVEQARAQGYHKAMSVAASVGFVILTGVLGWLLPQFVALKTQVVSEKDFQSFVNNANTVIRQSNK